MGRQGKGGGEKGKKMESGTYTEIAGIERCYQLAK
jgi:hypothetical protein